jgi:predicted MFS family arabinose efflux permease
MSAVPTGSGGGVTGRAWLVIGLLWVAAFLNYLDRNMILTMRLSVKEAIPMSEAQFGMLTSIFLWVYAGLSPFAGFLADRVSRARVIVGSLFVWSAVTLLTGFATSFQQLLVARALMGISEACYIPAALALIMDYHPGPTRSRATALHLTGFTVGAGMGGIGGVLADRHGWSYAFFLFGTVGIVHSIVMSVALRDAPGEGARTLEKPAFLEAVRSLFSRGSYVLLLGIWGLLGLAGWAMSGWLPAHLGERFGLSQGAAGFSATGYREIAACLGALAGGFLADRWSRVSPRGRIYAPIVGLAIATPGLFILAQAWTFPIALLGLLLYGARNFVDANMMPILCMVADPRYRATGFGIMNTVACGIGGAAISAGGLLRDANVDVAHMFTLAAVGFVVCGILLAFVKPSSAVSVDPAPNLK